MYSVVLIRDLSHNFLIRSFPNTLVFLNNYTFATYTSPLPVVQNTPLS